MDELEEALSNTIQALESQLDEMKRTYGPRLYQMQSADGSYLAAPILTALAHGYAALIALGEKKIIDNQIASMSVGIKNPTLHLSMSSSEIERIFVMGREIG
jgi:hypothetical protein